MSISSVNNYRNRRDGYYQRSMLCKNNLPTTGSVGRTFSSWVLGGAPATGAAPTTAVVPTSATAGALGQIDSTGTQRILRIISSKANPGGMLTIADRLSHQAGLSGTTTGAQTTNLPTAALTRNTSGVGVMCGLEVYTAVGTTGTTVTASYTNTTPSSGKTTQATTFGGTGFGTQAQRLILLPLAAGDVGVTQVASVTLAASTVSAAGNFGVTLFYPMVSIPFGDSNFIDADLEALFGLGTWFPTVATSACLFFVIHDGNNQATGVISADIRIGED